MNHRRIVAASTALLASFATLVGVAAPARAGTAVLADAHLDITFPNPTEFAVCADGAVEGGTVLIGEWNFTIDGVRSDTTRIQINDSGAGPTFHACEYIYTFGTPQGSFTATLSFVGEGTSAATKSIPPLAAPEVTGTAVDEASWTPQQNANLLIST
jgi:hypothetical protein